jgi:hypothetical protein
MITVSALIVEPLRGSWGRLLSVLRVGVTGGTGGDLTYGNT